MRVKYNRLLKKKNNLYYIVAGEASGDLHGSHLINALQSINPLITFRGIGGPRMNQSGFKSLADFHRLSVMGFLEIIKDLNFFIKLKKTIVNDILISKPQKIILIDYPGFNLKIVKLIRIEYGPIKLSNLNIGQLEEIKDLKKLC